MFYDSISTLVNGSNDVIVCGALVLVIVLTVVSFDIIVNSLLNLFKIKERR